MNKEEKVLLVMTPHERIPRLWDFKRVKISAIHEYLSKVFGKSAVQPLANSLEDLLDVDDVEGFVLSLDPLFLMIYGGKLHATWLCQDQWENLQIIKGRIDHTSVGKLPVQELANSLSPTIEYYAQKIAKELSSLTDKATQPKSPHTP